jgi:glycosyltransferase involved in cell wall biosynthesis
MDSFIHDLCGQLSPYLKIQPVVSGNPEDHLRAVRASSSVWLEWGNQLTGHLLAQKNVLAGKQVIVRIHSYEIYDRLVDSIDFSAATDVVFVSSFMREMFVKKNLPTAAGCRLHVIHNAIDTDRFALVPRGGEKRDVGFLAFISYKKDPMVMLHAFAHLAAPRPDLRLHIAGPFQDSRYEIGMPHFLAAAGLSDRATFYGKIGDADRWLASKDFILCSSLNESQGVGILEALSRGCRPLIYNFPGATDIYPKSFLWTTFADLEDRFANGPGPEAVSSFVAEHYSKPRETGGWLRLFLQKELVDEVFSFGDV